MKRKGPHADEGARRKFGGLWRERSPAPSSSHQVPNGNQTPDPTAAASSSFADRRLRPPLDNLCSGATPSPLPQSAVEPSIATPVAPPAETPFGAIALVVDPTSNQGPGPVYLSETTPKPRSSHYPTITSPGLLCAEEPPTNVPPIDNSDSRQSQLPGPATDPNSITPPSSNQSAKKTVRAGFKALMSVLNASADVFGPLKSAVSELSECVVIYERYSHGREDYETLGVELASLLGDLTGFFKGSTPPVMTSSIDNLAKGIRREVNQVKEKGQRGRMERMAEAKEDADVVLECYRRIRGLLARLGLNANLNTWKTVDEMATDNRLKNLPYASSAKYQSSESTNMREGCTPNTRIAVLKQLRAWAYDEYSEKIYWLNGMAGTGKTTIAYSLCDLLKDARKLAASFFCSRQLPECRNVNRIFPTLCYQLALFSRPFRYAISRVLEEDPDVHNQPLRQQFERLILEPLLEVKANVLVDRVVVIDALDECEDGIGVGQILDILLSHAPNLPLKFFVTSRPEAAVRERMLNRPGDRTRFELHLHELERSIVREDIQTYLQAKLGRINLSTADVKRLAEQSGALFIYASTLVRFIGAGNFSWDPQRRLATMLAIPFLSSESSKTIDGLYSTIVAAALHDQDLDECNKTHMKIVLDTVVCAQEPLKVSVLAGLLKLGGEQPVRNSLRSLLSVLHVSDADERAPEIFYCNKQEHNTQIAHLCFNMLNAHDPPFNICSLKSSYVRDDSVPGLGDVIKKSISNELFYASRYWGAHLKLGDYSPELIEIFNAFLSARFLFWMEIMNLKRCMHVGARLLDRVRAWIQKTSCPNDIRQLCQDASAFATTFSSSPASRSTPHIYVSMLPFWPISRPMSRCYVGKFQGLVKATGTAMARRNCAPLFVYNTQDCVTSVAFSPDGSRIAFSNGAYYDMGTVQILDAHTGQLIGEPLKGHTSLVNSVAYSHDGACIASGSDDKMIRIWDAQTGQIIGKPLTGHTDSVESVAYSRNSTHIVSGSSDKTIRIWNVHTSRIVGRSLVGHTKAVLSVAYSPDSARIVSGSEDTDVRIWDAHTGHTIGEPFQGHTEAVRSVAFSTDATRIVSGASDNTIRIWDVHTGQMIGKSLEGHADRVTSVVCSGDGACMISGSWDHTIRIWDAHTGKLMGKPLEGHINAITSLSVSSDGARIISGSYDRTIRIWDAHASKRTGKLPGGHRNVITSAPLSSDAAHIVPDGKMRRTSDVHTGQAIVTPAQGYTGPVLSVAYSSDGKRIVSCSKDYSVRTWDARTGRMIGEPRKIPSPVAYLDSDIRIVSGSSDDTIHVWNTHNSYYGFGDNPIWIWDMATGQSIGNPLKGHAGEVYSVAYSRDRTRVVSGSKDETIRIWDANTGQAIGKPLWGHTGEVYSVTFSADATRVVSGSWDETIRIWDVHTGQTIGQPLKGHTNVVTSVAYSGDDRLIVSGSGTGIRIWDAHTGQSIGQLEGHINWVNSVAFSGDGLHIVSGSSDETIRIWDIRTIPMIVPEVVGGAANLVNCDRPNVNPHGNWRVEKDGWAVADGSRLLIWVPPEVRDTLLQPENTVVISSQGSVTLDFNGAFVGEQWCQLHRPTSATSGITM